MFPNRILDKIVWLIFALFCLFVCGNGYKIYVGLSKPVSLWLYLTRLMLYLLMWQVENLNSLEKKLYIADVEEVYLKFLPLSHHIASKFVLILCFQKYRSKYIVSHIRIDLLSTPGYNSLLSIFTLSLLHQSRTVLDSARAQSVIGSLNRSSVDSLTFIGMGLFYGHIELLRFSGFTLISRRC